jgi:hypothetical protein
MKQRLISLSVTGATAACALVLAATSAFASAPRTTTWSVSPGGAIKGSLNTGTTTILKDTTSGQSISCSVAVANGSTKAGKGLPGAGLGKITTASWGTSTNPCKGPLSSTFTAVGTASTTHPWSLNAVSYKSTVDGGQTSGTLTNTATGQVGVGATLKGTVLGATCTAVVGGTTTARASANLLYDNTSGLMAITGTVNLKVLKSNCPTISVGDKVSFTTSPTSTAGKAVSHGYALSPKQKITSP